MQRSLADILPRPWPDMELESSPVMREYLIYRGTVAVCNDKDGAASFDLFCRIRQEAPISACEDARFAVESKVL